MQRSLSFTINGALFVALSVMPLFASALEWVQIGRVSGDNVCGSLETGIGDSRELKFHRYRKFVAGSDVKERIHVQRGSTVAVRLLGHGADVLPSLQEEIAGVTASVGARGRYVHQPDSSGPIGFVEVRIAVRNEAELGNNSVFVQWPLGRERIPLKIVRDCEQTRAAPTTSIPDSKCFGAAGSNCGVPAGPINALATCSGGLCLYNGGSLKHDECCAKNTSGHGCGGPETFISGERLCRADMDRAVSRVASGLSWHRDTDFSKVNADGRLVARDVCAPSGTIVHREDEQFCCSRMGVSRNPSSTERNQSRNNPMVKGYVTPGAAQASIPASAVACD